MISLFVDIHIAVYFVYVHVHFVMIYKIFRYIYWQIKEYLLSPVVPKVAMRRQFLSMRWRNEPPRHCRTRSEKLLPVAKSGSATVCLAILTKP